MMREILFRGKRLETEPFPGCWTTGSLAILGNGLLYAIFISGALGENISYAVDPATVGQYTGLTDKNGVKIFEGDIVACPFWRSNKNGTTMRGVVEFHNAAFSVRWEEEDYGRNFAGYTDGMLVVGNIHEDPELMGGGT